MPPRNGRHKQLQHAREVKRQKTLITAEVGQASYSDSGDAETLYCISSDEEIDDVAVSTISAKFLTWKEGAGSHLRSVYSGDSRTTKWRKQNLEKNKILSSVTSRKITDFFKIQNSTDCQPSVPADTERISDAISIDDGLTILRTFTTLTVNRTHERTLSNISKYDFLRYLALEQYFTLLRSPMSMVKASEIVSARLYPNKGQNNHSRTIRRWAEYFLNHKKLPVHQQGCHIKTRSLINDEDIARECRLWLRVQIHDSITAHSFSQWIAKELHPKVGLPSPITVSESTATRWLHLLGLNYGAYRKGMYVDGHERADVVQYRSEFLERMLKYEKRMTKYKDKPVDDGILVAVDPILDEGVRRLVLVTHDESCFSSNDGKTTIWMDEDNLPLRPKGEGRSIMVSDFLCECHGPLKLSSEQQRENPNTEPESVTIIKPGKNADGYWTNSDLVKQLEKVVLIFKVLHPDCDALFMFDNSQNHRALPPDALNAKVLPIKDGGKNVKPQRDGWFMEEGQKIVQSMMTPENKPKGLRTILTERGLWDYTLSRNSAMELLQQQPDFQEQSCWLQEVVSKHEGFLLDFYPKFHCEFNFIEMYWAACKAYTRRNCTYSFKDLVKLVPLALKSVPLSQIQKFARKSYRYMDAYRVHGEDGNKLTPKQVEYAVKKFRKHRSIPVRILNEL